MIISQGNINMYIDGNNLHQAAKELGFEIDYKKFRGWLGQKYHIKVAYLFIGFMKNRLAFYEYLERCGFCLIFKQTLIYRGVVKGNCDAELILKIISDFYKNSYDWCYLVSGDGDFSCIVEFLRDNNVFAAIISPDYNKCSIFLRDKNVEIVFLNNHYHKFSRRIV